MNHNLSQIMLKQKLPEPSRSPARRSIARNSTQAVRSCRLLLIDRFIIRFVAPWISKSICVCVWGIPPCASRSNDNRVANPTEEAKQNRIVFAKTNMYLQNTSCAHRNMVSHRRRDVGHVWLKAALEGLMRSFVLGADSLVIFHLPLAMRRANKTPGLGKAGQGSGKRSMKVICCPQDPPIHFEPYIYGRLVLVESTLLV